MQDDLARRLAQDSWFGSIAPAQRNLLMGQLRQRHTHAGERIYAFGSPPDALYVVIEGQVRLVSYPRVGKQVLHLVLMPPSWFGEVSVLDDGPRPNEAISVGTGILGYVALADFQKLAASAPALYRDLGILSCRHQRASLKYMGLMMSQTPPARIALLLLRSPRSPAPRGRPTLHMSQEDLAGMVGVSRQSTNKTLKRLQAMRLIELQYGRIIVTDEARLKAVVQQADKILNDA